MCLRGTLAGAYKAKDGWRIPITAHERLAIPEMTPCEGDALAGVPADLRDQATNRLGLIERFERFAAEAAARGVGRERAMESFCNDYGVAVRSLRRWISRKRRSGVRGLVDERGLASRIERAENPAMKYFDSLFLDPRRLTIARCRELVRAYNELHACGWDIPHVKAFERHVRDIPEPVRVLHREGLTAYTARCEPYIERDWDSVEPGAVWVGDHHQFNCWVRDRGAWVRPWVTAWLDMRSRMLVGWHISTGPNQATILRAFRRGVERYGPPGAVKIDNGKDYDSQCFTGETKQRRHASVAMRRTLSKGYLDETGVAGLYAMLGIEVSFAIPYNARAKSVERFFDTLDRQFTCLAATYCGKDPMRRPDDIADLLADQKTVEAAYDLAGFGEAFGTWAGTYNHSTHGGAGMDGQCPAEVFASRPSRRVLADGVLDLLAQVWSGEVVVGKNGVTLNGVRYGQYCSELLLAQGRKVRLAYDPDDLRSVEVYDAGTWEHLCRAEQNQLVAYGAAVDDQSLREAMRRQRQARKAVKDWVDHSLTANMDLVGLAIRAKADEVAEGKKRAAAVAAAAQPTLRPVATPLDGQVGEIERQRAVKAVRRASGAEGVKEVLDIDFGRLSLGSDGPTLNFKPCRLRDDGPGLTLTPCTLRPRP